MPEKNKLVLSVAAVVVLGVLLGAGAYLYVNEAYCIKSPLVQTATVTCTKDYSVYRIGIAADTAFHVLTTRPVLAAYVVYPPYSNQALKVPHGNISGNLYFVVLPDKNGAVFVSLWREGNVSYEAVSRGAVEQGVVQYVPDLNFCRSVVSELNVPIRYYRFYASSDRNGIMEFCSIRPAMDFNTVASVLSNVFKPTFEISGNLLYEVPDLNASATLYRRPSTILEVYRRARSS